MNHAPHGAYRVRRALETEQGKLYVDDCFLVNAFLSIRALIGNIKEAPRCEVSIP